MGDLTRTERNEFEQLKRDVVSLKKLGVSGGMSITRGPGGQMVISPPAAAGATGFYARITGNAGKRYGFVQVGVRRENPPGTVTDDVFDVPGGFSWDSAAVPLAATGWAYDIGGGSVALHTPAPALVVLMTPNPLVAGTWLFGPIVVCP